jgi:hypothetical protein
MFRQAKWVMLAIASSIVGCSAPRGPIEVSNPDPSGKILGMKKAVREHDMKVVRQLIKDLESDDPAVRLFAIHTLEQLTGKREGYDYYADETQRQPAIKKWHEWLAQQEGTAPSGRPADDSRLVGGKTGE